MMTFYYFLNDEFSLMSGLNISVEDHTSEHNSVNPTIQGKNCMA